MKKDYKEKNQLNTATKYKLKAIDLYNLTKGEDIFTLKTEERIKKCGYWVRLKYTEDFSISKVMTGYFCGNRFCPFCSYGSSLKNAINISAMINYLVRLKYQFVYLTLTVPNCEAEALNDEVKNINKAWNQLKKRKWFEKNFLGYIKKLEITKNDNGTYHPHLHILLAVENKYFNQHNIVRPEKIIKSWKKCTKREVETQAQNIKKFRNTYGSIMELAIYQSKPNEMLQDLDSFKTFYSALKGKNVFNYGGVFKAVKLLIKNNELDSSFFPSDEIVYKWVRDYRWKKNHYHLLETRELTEKDLF